MSDASFTTSKRKQRTLFADSVIQHTAVLNGLRKKLLLEGGNNQTAMTYDPHYYYMKSGAIFTTIEERQSYIDSVPGTNGGGGGGGGDQTIPDSPTDISAVAGFAEAIVSFTPPENDGGSAITLYTVVSSPDGIVATGTSSPIIVPYLSNNTSYTFTVIATNAIGDSISSADSNSITTTTPSDSAPTITGINALTTSLIVTFSAPASFGTISNYEYSLDGGDTFTALSPTDASSPITITSLTTTTSYSVAIRAINNVPETGDSSNVVPVTTASTQITETFASPGTLSWTAPANVRYVQYLVVGAGGGGGGCYSKINVLGNVPVQSSAPVGGGYWIYNGTTTATYTYARMYNGSNTNTSGGASTFTEPIQLTASADTNVPPGGNDGTRWHGTKEVVYYLETVGPPRVSNFGYGSYFVGSQNNLPSGGSGGGACGQIKATFGATQFYNVTPRTSYTVIVGDGGEGGIGATDEENAGSKGGDSTFDTLVSEGGSGGQPSRVLTNNTDGYFNGGRGGQDGSDTLREGQGGQGAGGAGQQQNVTIGGYGGAASGVGVNFTGAYGPGGSGGAPNTVASGTTTANIGAGGKGTGATVNSFASGIKGGTGVVILKYYV
jgi:hypothetical protein